MERGTFFLLLFFGIAPAMALLLLGRGLTRAVRENRRRTQIVVLMLGALGLWTLASDVMLEIGFEVAWQLAHTRPFPDGLFPEGWQVYGYLAVYSAFGSMLVWLLGAIPPKSTTT